MHGCMGMEVRLKPGLAIMGGVQPFGFKVVIDCIPAIAPMDEAVCVGIEGIFSMDDIVDVAVIPEVVGDSALIAGVKAMLEAGLVTICDIRLDPLLCPILSIIDSLIDMSRPAILFIESLMLMSIVDIFIEEPSIKDEFIPIMGIDVESSPRPVPA